MKTLRFVVAAAVFAATFSVVVVRAAAPSQTPGAQQQVRDTDATKSALVTLKMTVTISRFEGEKKTGSLPFVLMVIPSASGSPRDGDTTRLQMGTDVPVPTTAISVQTGDSGAKPVQSYQYRPVGTNVGASATSMEDGRFSVNLMVTDSQVVKDPGGQSGGGMSGLPKFQNFTSSNRLILRDGQTVQYTAATDKTSGEVVKIDVTLNVIK